MTTQEAIERLTAMVDDSEDQTWDHSPKDHLALELCLAEIVRLQLADVSEDEE